MSVYQVTVNVEDEKHNRKSDTFLRRSGKNLDDFSFDIAKGLRRVSSEE